MDNAYLSHLANQEYNSASELWSAAEARLKEYVQNGDVRNALAALSDLRGAVEKRFYPLLNKQELSNTFLGILGGILHFACRDAGLPPAYLTMMILTQKDILTSVGRSRPALQQAAGDCVIYACHLVRHFVQPQYSPLVRRCVTLIHERLSDEVSVARLAFTLCVTRQYLSSQFHQETGKTLTEYVNVERITLSKYYLRRNQLSITQIALMCGYNDSNYFGRTFKKITGKTPGEYRRAMLV